MTRDQMPSNEAAQLPKDGIKARKETNNKALVVICSSHNQEHKCSNADSANI